MNHRERVDAILHYRDYDRVPLVSFAYWTETIEKWAAEGHVSKENAESYYKSGDNSPGDRAIMKQLGFDFNWNTVIGGNPRLNPPFEEKIIEVLADGSEIYSDGTGHIQQRKPGVVSIPAEIGTLLKDRQVWEADYLPRLQYSDTDNRVNTDWVMERARQDEADGLPLALHCGSLIGSIRDMLGVVEMSYMMADDEDLFAEIIAKFGELSYKVAERILKTGIKFTYAHFWEDICFKNGPLVSPAIFEELIGPQYKKITGLLNSYGVDIVSVDCDGKIDSLVPIWLENGVNTMFPIEVGTWHASIAPWREQYGKDLRGVGGMDKRVFAQDKAAVDAEIKRLRKLVDLGGYIPCPDHRIAPDAEYALVAYYCEQFRKEFS